MYVSVTVLPIVRIFLEYRKIIWTEGRGGGGAASDWLHDNYYVK